MIKNNDMGKYLNKSGVTYLYKKIKTWVSRNFATRYSVERLETMLGTVYSPNFEDEDPDISVLGTRLLLESVHDFPNGALPCYVTTVVIREGYVQVLFSPIEQCCWERTWSDEDSTWTDWERC